MSIYRGHCQKLWKGTKRSSGVVPMKKNDILNYPRKLIVRIAFIITLLNTLQETVRHYQIENNFKDAGNYSLTFDASGLTSGIYFIRMTSGNNFYSTKKMILIK